MNTKTEQKISIQSKRRAFEALKKNPFLKTANQLTPDYPFLTPPSIQKNSSSLSPALPFYQFRVAAGVPGQAEHIIEQSLDLQHLLLPNPTSSFCVRVQGDSMVGAGIHDNDLLIVDTRQKPQHNSIVIASVYGELTVKRLKLLSQKTWLVPENPDFKPLEITESMDFTILGVVLHAIHSL